MSCPATIAHAVQEAQEWLKQVRDYAEGQTSSTPYGVLRAVLHQLRDRLTFEEAFELAAQLPLIIRGVYFEGYQPSHAPEKIRSKQMFFNGVAAKLQPHRVAPDAAIRAVFATLAYRCDAGEVAHVINQLPAELKDMWPKQSH